MAPPRPNTRGGGLSATGNAGNNPLTTRKSATPAGPVPRAVEPGPGPGRGRQVGASNYSDEELLAIFDAAEAERANSKAAWELVATTVNAVFKHGRSGPAVQKKFEQTVKKAQELPTGQTEVPEVLKRANEVDEYLKSLTGLKSLTDRRCRTGKSTVEEDAETANEEESGDAEDEVNDPSDDIKGKHKAVNPDNSVDHPAVASLSDNEDLPDAAEIFHASPKADTHVSEPWDDARIEQDLSETHAAPKTPTLDKKPTVNQQAASSGPTRKLASVPKSSPVVLSKTSGRGQTAIPQAQGKVGTTPDDPILLLSQDVILEIDSDSSSIASSSVEILDEPTTILASYPTHDQNKTSIQKRKAEDTEAGPSKKTNSGPSASRLNPSPLAGIESNTDPKHLVEMMREGNMSLFYTQQMNSMNQELMQLREELRLERTAREEAQRALAEYKNRAEMDDLQNQVKMLKAYLPGIGGMGPNVGPGGNATAYGTGFSANPAVTPQSNNWGNNSSHGNAAYMGPNPAFGPGQSVNSFAAPQADTSEPFAAPSDHDNFSHH
ncbi:hypothetical protein RhiLY_08628 [Ceratobasidium sp. AG-Ba]|nr:hypothetical protein RhiLY_08628 [Ceratobasidium sp. AG-Ba]